MSACTLASLRAGERVCVVVTAGNRIARKLTDPNLPRLRFEEVRRQITFGQGIHTCPVAQPARVEDLVAVLLLTCVQHVALTFDVFQWPDSLLDRGRESLLVSLRPTGAGRGGLGSATVTSFVCDAVPRRPQVLRASIPRCRVQTKVRRWAEFP